VPTYISLLNFTDQGIETIGDTVWRVDEATERAKQYDCKLLQSYWTVGPYDLVFILEAPDDESATTFLLDTASRRGGVRTTTLRAHNREEMSRILTRLGY
jgi:uncharacterized protein with GYD domain